MTYIVCCPACGVKKPDKIFEKKKGHIELSKGLGFGYIQNHGVFYCPHVKVYERTTVSRWKKIG